MPSLAAAVLLVLQIGGRDRLASDAEQRLDQSHIMWRKGVQGVPKAVESPAGPMTEGEVQLRQEREWDTHASLQVCTCV